MTFNEDGLENLRYAIINLAMRDYATALRSIDRYRKRDAEPPCETLRVVSDCESFFRGSWMENLSDLQGDYIIERIRRKIGVG